MGDMGEYWRDVKPVLKQMSRHKRQANRKEGERVLLSKRIPFLNKNDGAHLIVWPDDQERRVDYWPGTGLWRSYWGTHEGRGIASMLKFIEAEPYGSGS